MGDVDRALAALQVDDDAVDFGGLDIGGSLAWRQAQLGFVDPPPYAPLTMAAVRAAEGRRGLTLVSTFSGCGGSSMGFRLAGYRVLWANEFIPAARDTYLANFPTTPVDARDIRQVAPGDILAAIGLPPGSVDVLEGSPPCASFSMSGKRERHWGQVKAYSDTKQRVDDLFFEFVRVLEGVMPRAFVAENVAGLLLGVAADVFRAIVDALEGAGYRVAVQVVDASWFGVPQSRRRVIFMGFREDLRISPRFPDALTYRYGVQDACPWLAAPGIPCPLPLDDPEDVGVTLPPDKYAISRAAQTMRPGDTSERYFNLTRLRARGPAQTILAMHGQTGTASVIAPWEDRKLHIPEVRRLCAFPDDFVLTGNFKQRWERLGRAVPPPLMAAIADAVARQLEGSR